MSGQPQLHQFEAMGKGEMDVSTAADHGPGSVTLGGLASQKEGALQMCAVLAALPAAGGAAANTTALALARPLLFLMIQAAAEAQQEAWTAAEATLNARIVDAEARCAAAVERERHTAERAQVRAWLGERLRAYVPWQALSEFVRVLIHTVERVYVAAHISCLLRPLCPGVIIQQNLMGASPTEAMRAQPQVELRLM